MPAGLVSVTNLRGTPREGWRRITVAEAMVPWSRVVRVEANADLLTALLVMAEAGVTQVPVMSPGGAEAPPVGILSRDDVTQYLRVRRELGV
ncbi:MAG: hypothetical protein AVDCRST_MAG88-2140 [uncultured Thermomicrobiales bacterium]|uniref:CBS domain-containing protein n=1 Tax=uncultured Thermomicrobiales bacterium TaxID=1645740 RepID=A0A6J4V7P4_9BACT|nr:MAG: hypothetical protein AVDCRST_MAG88-2140 [uncultured Thermomicrobiales bacterium]